MMQGTKNEPILEEIMYHLSLLISHVGPSSVAPSFSIVIKGGNDITAAMTQTITIMHFILLGVRLRLYSIALVMDQYRSRLMAHRWAIDAVQNKTSRAR